MTQLINEKLKKCCENCHSLLDKPCAWLSLGNEYCDAIMEVQQEIERLNKCYCNRSDCAGRLNQKNEVYDSVVQRNEKAIEYIENEMPCLWEVDDIWEDIDGNYQHNYKEYDPQILLNKLKGDDKE